MNEEIIRELLNTRDFYNIMYEYNLYKYDFLDIISNCIYSNAFKLEDKEKEVLKDIYRDNGCMFKIKDDAVVFISDTHFDYSSLDKHDINRWDLLYYVLEFCKDKKIRYLIHGGDIGDGTIQVSGVKKPINFDEGSYELARRQVNNILNKYPSVFEIHQSLLGGNHDERYLYYDIDILKEFADKKDIYPLGYKQAFFSVFNKTISLEHENRPYRIKCRNLISHDLTIHGHSHIALFQDNDVYLPALGGFLNHKNEKGGEFGFLVMYPYNERELVKLEFEHYYLRDESFVKEDNPYVYKLKK